METDTYYAQARQAEALKQAAAKECANFACRERTVGELLDTHIANAERHLKALYDLKSCLSGNVLASGASRFASLLGV